MDDICKDPLLWLRSKQGQYAGYEKGSQDDIRHQYFKAAADEMERMRAALTEISEFAGLCLLGSGRYDQGSNAAYEQCADIAKRALPKGGNDNARG